MGGDYFGKVDDAWEVLALALPRDGVSWRRTPGRRRGFAGTRRPGDLLRPILLRLGCGHSLRRTALRVGPLADRPGLSDVALLKRARKSKDWLHALCVRLFEELRLAVLPEGASDEVRTVDAVAVKERRLRGSQWYLHYSV